MADYRFCTVEDEGRIRIVTINRPEVMNALHSEAHWEFDGIWNEFAADPELWVGIITGAGERAFSAGNDLKVQAAGRRGPRPATGPGPEHAVRVAPGGPGRHYVDLRAAVH